MARGKGSRARGGLGNVGSGKMKSGGKGGITTPFKGSMVMKGLGKSA